MNSDTANQTQQATPDVANASEMSNLIADVEEVLGKAGHIIDADVTRLRNSLRLKIAAARSTLSAGGERITEAATTAASATDNYVHRSPWQAMAIAAVAGAALGYLLARRQE